MNEVPNPKSQESAPASDSQKNGEPPVMPESSKELGKSLKEWEYEAAEKSRVKNHYFIVFDPSVMKTKIVRAYLNEMGFKDSTSVHSMQDLLKVLVKLSVDASVRSIIITSFVPTFVSLQTAFLSDSLESFREKMPHLLDIPRFACIEKNAPPIPSGLLDHKWVMNLGLSPEFSRKKTLGILGYSQK